MRTHLTAREQFGVNMLNDEYRAYYLKLSPLLQTLARMFPFKEYKLKPDSKYALMPPGTRVKLLKFDEHGRAAVQIIEMIELPASHDYSEYERVTHQRMSKHAQTYEVWAYINPADIEPYFKD